MPAMPGAWAESPELCAKYQSLPTIDDDFYSHLTTETTEDDDNDSVRSYETCASTPGEEPYQHQTTYSFPPHIPPRILQNPCSQYHVLAPIEKRRRSYTRLFNVNPPRPRANESKLRKPFNNTGNRTPSNADLEHERDGLKMLVQEREAQLALCEQKLEQTVRGQACTTARMKEAQLALEKAVKEHAVSEEMMTARLGEAEFKADVRQHFDKSEDEVNELRKASKAQWQRANNAEQRIQCLENDLAKANSDLQQARNADDQTSTLQQQLNTSLQSLHNAEHEIETLRAALTTSDNNNNEIYRQAVEHIQSLSEEATQEVQRLDGLGAIEEARANRAEKANQSLQQRIEAQDAQVRSLQDEAQRWEKHAKERLERATLGATKVGELTHEVSEIKTRAQNAEAKVKELEQKIANTTVAEKGEATEEPSPDDMEAACAITSMNDRLERELDEANNLLEELALNGMDKPCQDALESLVKTNQVFKQVEEEFEDHHSPRVDEVNTILEDAMSDLDMSRFVDLADKPVLVRQLKEAHHARTLIDDILEIAEIAYQVYLDEEQTEEIEKILKAPRTLPETDDAAAAPSSPPRAPQPTTSTTTTTTTSAPLYNPPRAQPTPTYLPGLPTNPNASPTSGAPTPYNPLWSLTQTTSPTAPSSSSSRPHNPSSLRSLVPEFQPHEASPSPSSEHDSDLDAEGDTDDDENVMPEAFAGQYDHGSDYDDEPAVVSRPIRQPVSRRRRRGDPNAAVFM